MTQKKLELLARQLINGMHPKIFQKKPNIDHVFNFKQVQQNYGLTNKEVEKLKTKVKELKK